MAISHGALAIRDELWGAPARRRCRRHRRRRPPSPKKPLCGIYAYFDYRAGRSGCMTERAARLAAPAGCSPCHLRSLIDDLAALGLIVAEPGGPAGDVCPAHIRPATTSGVPPVRRNRRRAHRRLPRRRRRFGRLVCRRTVVRRGCAVARAGIGWARRAGGELSGGLRGAVLAGIGNLRRAHRRLPHPGVGFGRLVCRRAPAWCAVSARASESASFPSATGRRTSWSAT